VAGQLVVAVTPDVASVKLFDGAQTDVTALFTQSRTGQTVTLTPVAGPVELNAVALTVKASDAAGNVSPASSVLTYTFDKKAPAAPSLSAASGAGALAGQLVVAVASDVASVKLFNGVGSDVTALFAQSRSGQTVTLTPVAGQVELSAASLTAKASDAAGNVSPASGALTYTFDNKPPVAPSLSLASGAGVVAGQLVVAGAPDVASVKLFDGDTTDVTALFTQSRSGQTVTLTPVAGPVELNAVALTAKASDAAGNVSPASSALTYTFDNKAPVAPSLSAASGAGAVAGQLVVAVTPDVPSVQLFTGGGSDVTAPFTPLRSGQTVTLTPVAGQVELSAVTLTAKASDAAGNVSPASSALTYTFDNKPPLAPASIDGTATAGQILVKLSSGPDQLPASVKLFAGSTDVTSRFDADTSISGQVTFSPKALQV
jgi:predicted GIY-YIG superfamily endonuclease